MAHLLTGEQTSAVVQIVVAVVVVAVVVVGYSEVGVDL